MGNELVFLPNEAEEEEGLGNAGIETYRDAPYASVGRECGQNSADAAAEKPVELRFDLERVPIAEYPMHAQQVAAIDRCLAKAKQKKDEKEIEFFSRARKVLTSEVVPIMKIADRNTKGLIGPAEPGTPFHSLVKSNGVSNKESAASGGSFGIGKNAAFAVSELQTVFYSTKYQDAASKKPVFLAQGKTILISHSDELGRQNRATGYWGRMPGFKPVVDEALVPGWLQRDGIGTTVVVAGFRESPDWQFRIAESLLQNFFCALYRGEIRFLVDNGSIVISKDTIEAWFSEPRVIKAAKDGDDLEDFLFAKSLYECLKSPDTIKKDLSIPGLGPVSLLIFMADKLPKRVRIVRNGMAITDTLAHFGEKFASFPMYRDFVALVEPASEGGSAFIKRLENPQHNGLSAERIADPEKRAEAVRMVKQLAKAVRSAIKEQALKPPEKRVTLDELSEFFDAPNVSDQEKKPGAEENPETLTYKVDPSRSASARETSSEDGGEGGRGTGKGGGRKGKGGGSEHGKGKGGRGKAGRPDSIALHDFRNIHQAEGEYHRRIFFTPLESGDLKLRTLAAGLDTPTQLDLKGADKGSVKDGVLALHVSAGTRYSIGIQFADEYDGPIELVAAKSEGAVT